MTAQQLIEAVMTTIFNPLIRLLVAVAFAVFIYGVIEFIAGSDNDVKREQGKKHLMWGVIGLFIMLGVMGLIEVLLNFWDFIDVIDT